MRAGRPLSALALQPDERTKLKLMVRRPKTDQRTALRSGIVLDCADGLSNKAVAANRKVTVQTVCNWRARFLQGRLSALGDPPRSGQPRKLTVQIVEAVVARTLETRPKNATHWTTLTMAAASGLN
jgi:transposase